MARMLEHRAHRLRRRRYVILVFLDAQPRFRRKHPAFPRRVVLCVLYESYLYGARGVSSVQSSSNLGTAYTQR